jgi:hypothetical protein
MSMMTMYVDRAGHPVDLEEWAMLQNMPDYRRVGATMWRRYYISTIWTGIALLGGPYESMVFYRPKHHRGVGIDCAQWRYIDERDARRGHAMLVAMARNHAWHAPTAHERDEHRERVRSWR